MKFQLTYLCMHIPEKEIKQRKIYNNVKVISVLVKDK